MRTIKMKFLLPVAVFMIAIVAAFASQTDGQEVFALEQGYAYVNEICVPTGQCSSIPARPCTHNGLQVFGKSGETSCLKTLYMPWQN